MLQEECFDFFEEILQTLTHVESYTFGWLDLWRAKGEILLSKTALSSENQKNTLYLPHKTYRYVTRRE